MLPIELQVNDLERIEKTISTVVKISVTTVFVALTIGLWIQAPGLDFAFQIGGGSVHNINVGYAVIFGPLIICFLLIWQFTTRKKLLLLVESLDYFSNHQHLKRLESLPLMLGGFSKYKRKFYFDIYWVANKLLRNIFYFFIPSIVSIVCFFRLMSFIPMEVDGKEMVFWEQTANPARYNCVSEYSNPCDWSKSQHIQYWLFGVSMSGVQPTLKNKDIETDKNRGASFPYIYPYTIWISIFLVITNCWLAHYCFKLSVEPLKKYYNGIVSDC